MALVDKTNYENVLTHYDVAFFNPFETSISSVMCILFSHRDMNSRKTKRHRSNYL